MSLRPSSTFLDNHIESYFVQVAKLKIPGSSGFTLFMNNPSVSSTLEDIWGVGGIRTTITAPETLELVSTSALDTSAGTGARTVLVLSLDANFNNQQNLVVMNGTTPVVLPNTIINAQRLIVASVGSGKVNAGDITIQVSSAGAPRGRIRVGKSLSHDCFFTVPAGFNTLGITLFPSWPKNESGRLRSLVKNFGADQADLTTVEFPVYQSSVIAHPKLAGIRPQKSDIFFRATSDNPNVEVNCIAEFLVYPNDSQSSETVLELLELMVQGM